MIKTGSTIRLHDGRVTTLGREISQGGEGTVFEVPSSPDLVAKIFKLPPSAEKQVKLQAMIQMPSEKLKKFSAWPEALIAGGNGALAGFVMPNLSGQIALHELYSPVDRKQHFPQADWSFLVHVARNLAAAFGTLHQAGIVVGDVNENFAFVHPQTGIVRIIDIDSTQITVNGKTLRTEVGVPNFTPPELQGVSSRSIVRTTQHDAFGLALHIFHLLFFGRHPFAGVPQGNEDLQIDEAIQAFSYAYRADQRTTRLRPPPGTVSVGVAGNEIVTLFERAFAPFVQPRPEASEWFSALGDLGNRMTRCPQEGAHVFANHLSECPWCTLESKSGFFLFVSRVTAQVINAARFDLGKIWALIESVKQPDLFSIRALSIPAAKPTPLRFIDRFQKPFLEISKVLVFLFAVGLCFVAPKLWIVFLLVGGAIAQSIRARPSLEATKRLDSLAVAQDDLKRALAAFETHAGPQRFHAYKMQLVALREQYRNIPEQYNQRIALLKASIHTSQKRKFLERFPIRNASIPNIGPGRKSTLVSFGVLTAADCYSSTFPDIPRFKDALISALVSWREGLEGNFVFDPKQGVDPQDISKINRETEALTRRLESELRNGYVKLQQIKKESDTYRARMIPALQSLAVRLTQAEADVSLVIRK